MGDARSLRPVENCRRPGISKRANPPRDRADNPSSSQGHYSCRVHVRFERMPALRHGKVAGGQTVRKSAHDLPEVPRRRAPIYSGPAQAVRGQESQCTSPEERQDQTVRAGWRSRHRASPLLPAGGSILVPSSPPRLLFGGFRSGKAVSSPAPLKTSGSAPSRPPCRRRA